LCNPAFVKGCQSPINVCLFDNIYCIRTSDNDLSLCHCGFAVICVWMLFQLGHGVLLFYAEICHRVVGLHISHHRRCCDKLMMSCARHPAATQQLPACMITVKWQNQINTSYAACTCSCMSSQEVKGQDCEI